MEKMAMPSCIRTPSVDRFFTCIRFHGSAVCFSLLSMVLSCLMVSWTSSTHTTSVELTYSTQHPGNFGQFCAEAAYTPGEWPFQFDPVVDVSLHPALCDVVACVQKHLCVEALLPHHQRLYSHWQYSGEHVKPSFSMLLRMAQAAR